MSKSKVSITIEHTLLKRIDQIVAEQQFANRSRLIQEAVQEKVERIGRHRLARECAKLDPAFEQQLADEGLKGDLEEWPEYC